MITIEQIRILITDACAVIARLAGTGIVEREESAPRLVVLDLDVYVDLAFFCASAQQHVGLLDRMLREQLKVARDFRRVGRLALLDRRKAAPDVLLVEVAVAVNHDPPDAGLHDPELHDALGDVLLGEQHLNHTVTAIAIRLLESFQRALDVGEILVRSRKGRNRSLDHFRGEQGISLHIEALDLETRRSDRRLRLLGVRANRNRTEGAATRQQHRQASGPAAARRLVRITSRIQTTLSLSFFEKRVAVL